MKAYSIFDDFDYESSKILLDSGIDLTIHPLGKPRPSSEEFKTILQNYDIAIVGTSQKITSDMFENITTPKIIATASVGVDHIVIPDDKKELIKIINTPTANAQSVAEYVFATVLCCRKRIFEGCKLYEQGLSNKSLSKKPEDLFGSTIGIIGAGNISKKIMEFASMWGMRILCFTLHPENHNDLIEKYNVNFVSLEDLVSNSDIVSVNLPSTPDTNEIISDKIVSMMKNDAIFVSISRGNVLNINALLKKAKEFSNFYVCLDLDVIPDVSKEYYLCDNVIITPHIAGGTIETRKRMFKEVSYGIVKSVENIENNTKNYIKL